MGNPEGGADADRIIGRFQRLADTVYLMTDSQPNARALSLSSVVRLEESSGRNSVLWSTIWKGAAGLVLGGLVGGLLGYHSVSPDDTSWFAELDAAATGMAILGSMGFVVGVSLGVAFPGEGWRQVILD